MSGINLNQSEAPHGLGRGLDRSTVSGPECDVRPRRCLQVVCLGSLSRHVAHVGGAGEDVDTQMADGAGKRAVHEEGRPLDAQTEAAERPRDSGF